MADIPNITINRRPASPAPYRQWIRKVGLVVAQGEKGLDLSQMRIKFRVLGMDFDAPPTAEITVYNLKPETAKRIQDEYTFVSLQAGYENGNFGVIFEGTIARVRVGKEKNTDSYVVIEAATGDKAFNFGIVNKTLAAGASYADKAQAAIDSMTAQDGKVTQGSLPNSLGTGGVLPRGRVLFGLGRGYLSDVSSSTGSSWFIGPDGVLNMVELTGYLPGEAVVLNSLSGLIGIPEATNDGIKVTCLLNPMIKIGSRIQINNKDINQTTIRQQGFPRYTDINFPANVTNDGFYRVLVLDQAGDTRANDPWYSFITCLSIDPSGGQGAAITPYGGGAVP